MWKAGANLECWHRPLCLSGTSQWVIRLCLSSTVIEGTGIWHKRPKTKFSAQKTFICPRGAKGME